MDNENNNNSLIVYETLIKDNFFFTYIDDYIYYNISHYSNFNTKYIPSIIYIIYNLLITHDIYINIMKPIRCVDDFKDLFYKFNNYIITKIKEMINFQNIKNCNFNESEFTEIYHICLELLLINIKFKNNKMCCFSF